MLSVYRSEMLFLAHSDRLYDFDVSETREFSSCYGSSSLQLRINTPSYAVLLQLLIIARLDYVGNAQSDMSFP